MPKWIVVENGDVFEGHQGHWADYRFSNALIRLIEADLQDDGLEYVIRDMTEDELKKFPEAVDFEQWLLKEYGEI